MLQDIAPTPMCIWTVLIGRNWLFKKKAVKWWDGKMDLGRGEGGVGVI